MKYQLEISNITKSYGDLKANDDVSLSIKSSSIHALLGENGAGFQISLNLMETLRRMTMSL